VTVYGICAILVKKKQVIIPNYQKRIIDMDDLYPEDQVKRSFDLLLSLGSPKAVLESLPFNRAENQDFGLDFYGSKVKDSDFRNCRFTRTQFSGANAQNSRFIGCVFNDCEFSSCNMQYCDFSGSIFNSNNPINEIRGSNFSYSDFSHSQINGLHSEGVTFLKSRFIASELSNVALSKSTFEASIFDRAVIKDCDFAKASFRYCLFDDVVFLNTCFPLLDMPFNFGLINHLLKSNELTITARALNGSVYSSFEIVNVLKDLLPYYNETDQYFAYCNLLLMNKKIVEARQAFRIAIEATVQTSNFTDCRIFVGLLYLAIYSAKPNLENSIIIFSD